MPSKTVRRAIAVCIATTLTLTSCTVQDSGPVAAVDCSPRPQDVGVALGAVPANLDDADLGRIMDSIRDLGASRVRIDFDWSVMEAVEGSVDWSGTDRLVDAITSRGMAPLGVITYTPAWAIPADGDRTDSHSAPADAAEYGDFAGRVAAHYANTVTAWEIWNEPNLSAFFLPRPDVSKYADLLSAAHRQITSVQPDATIVSGGLSPATDESGAIAPENFVKQLYAAGVADDFDVLGVHPYSYPAMPDDRSTGSYNLFVRLDILRDRMREAGDESKPMWLTEYGAPTGTAPDAVSDRSQADIIRAGICQARDDDGVDAIYLYTIRDMGSDGSDREDNFGLIRQDFTRKPAFDEVRSTIVG